MGKISLLVAITAVLALFVVMFVRIGDPTVSHNAKFSVDKAYARAVGASAMAGAAFMQITNQSGQDDILTGAKTNVSAMTELHTHIDDGDGVIKMRQIVGGIKLAAGETIVMKRGGDHVMLMGLNDSLDTGETLEITLTFKEAGDVMVEVPVDNDR